MHKPHRQPSRAPRRSAGRAPAPFLDLAGLDAGRDDDLIEPSATATNHEAHFLERVLRCEGADLDRAMRLYHHSGVVRKEVPGLLGMIAPEAERGAIALRSAPPSPYVVVTREGHFVTCLGEGMSPRGLTVLPYAPLKEAMDRADATWERARLWERQMQELPPSRLFQALREGPGSLTREMVEIVLRDPALYEAAIYKSFRLCWRVTVRFAETILDGAVNRRLEVESLKVDAMTRALFVLLGGVDTAWTLECMIGFLQHSNMYSVDAMAALSRHRRGGDLMMQLAENPAVGLQARYLAVDGVLHNLVWWPENGQLLLPRLWALELTPRNHGDLYILHQLWVFGRFLPQVFEDLFHGDWVALCAHYRNRMPRTELPEMIPPHLGSATLATYSYVALQQMPLSRWFTLEAGGAAARASFAQMVRAVPDRPLSLPVVPPRRAQRVGRNQSCPCGSGRKYKACCALKAPPPAAATEERYDPPGLVDVETLEDLAAVYDESADVRNLARSAVMGVPVHGACAAGPSGSTSTCQGDAATR